jgi:hypothetical protein
MATAGASAHSSWNIVRINPSNDLIAQYGTKLRFLLEYVRQLGPQYVVKIADRPMTEAFVLDDPADGILGTLGSCKNKQMLVSHVATSIFFCCL